MEAPTALPPAVPRSRACEPDSQRAMSLKQGLPTAVRRSRALTAAALAARRNLSTWVGRESVQQKGSYDHRGCPMRAAPEPREARRHAARAEIEVGERGEGCHAD